VTTITVRVRPKARTSTLEHVDGTWKATLTSAPVDGKANAELIALVARHFGCPRSAVSIRVGATGRTKIVCVDT
jgi:hypothetical protein